MNEIINIVNTEKQNNDEQSDPFLASPKAFHLEMPLYRYFDLSNWKISKIIHDHMIFKNTIDAYCIWCKKEGVFREHRSLYYHPSKPMWTPGQDGLNEIEFRCTRNSSHAYHSYYFKNGDVFAKVGQYPSVADFQIPQAEKYRKVLGDGQYKELTRGIGLAAHGVGIGSFVYLRRVFENLIEEVTILAVFLLK